MSEVVQPFKIFTDSKGEPLEDGFVYIGTASLNPETNPEPVYWDSANTEPAAQPIRTLGGYLSRNGSPARLFISGGSYSITVRDKQGRLIYTTTDTGVDTGYTVTPENFGAAGDGSSNDATALSSAIAFAQSSGLQLVGRGVYRVDSQVNFRYTNVDFELATINVNHSSGPGILIGGDANDADNPRQMFGAVLRVSGVDAQETPTVRAIGVKGQ